MAKVNREVMNELGNLFPITSYLCQEEVGVNSKRIGLIFPLYFQSMPKVVMEFIQKIKSKDSDYIFAVVTRGGGSYKGGVLSHLRKVLRGKNQHLSAGFYVHMPENYIPSLKVPTEEYQKKLFQKAEQKIESIS